MQLDLNDQEGNYFLQILVQRPLAEALPLYLKVTAQQLVPLPTQSALPLKVVPDKS